MADDQQGGTGAGEWQPELDDLARRRALARAMGGAANVARQAAAGRLTVRERFDRILDVGSFDELGSLTVNEEYGPDGELVSMTPSNIVFGIGRIDGREVVISGDDFTIRGGSSEASNRYKSTHLERLAHEQRMPLIRMVEGSGGGGSVRGLEMKGRPMLPFGLHSNHFGVDMMHTLNEVPVVGLCLGPVAGIGVLKVVASHYTLMVEGMSQMFFAGPALVAAAGEPLPTKDELGGAEVHGPTGAIDDIVGSEDEAFERTRRFLSYLPSSVWEAPPRAPSDDPVDRREDWLVSAVPKNRRRSYDMRDIISALVDRDSFLELGRRFGQSVIMGLARLDGWPVMVMAGNPAVSGGAWSSTSAEKIARFIDLASTFHLPVVHLVDCPGFEIGRAAEASNLARHAARAFFAINNFTGPWCSIIVRNCFGLGGGAHQPGASINTRVAWPSARWGSLPIEGGVEAAYKRVIAASDDPEATRAEIYAKLDAMQSPMLSAVAYDIEEIIDPRETRPLLCRFANRAQRLARTGPPVFTYRP